MTSEERAVLIAQCRAAVEAEPEFPDSMPDAMWEALCISYSAGDRGDIEESYRLAVRATKAGILERMPR